jgi:hypothetical protein
VHRLKSSWRFAGPIDDKQPHTQDDIEEYRFYFSDYESGQTQTSLRCLHKAYHLQSWIELPTNPDEVPNKNIDCGNFSTQALERFNRLVKGEQPADC